MLTHAFSENGESEILIWEPVTASIRSDQHRDGHKRGPKPQEEIRLDSFLFRPSYQSCHPTSHMTEKGGAKFLQTSLAPTLALHWQLTTFVRGATETWMCEVWGYSAYMGMACDKVWLLSHYLVSIIQCNCIILGIFMCTCLVRCSNIDWVKVKRTWKMDLRAKILEFLIPLIMIWWSLWSLSLMINVILKALFCKCNG